MVFLRPHRSLGPYKTGVRDLGLYPGPGELTPEGHLFGRLFYPCDHDASSWTPILWADGLYSASGYAHFPFAHLASSWRNTLMRSLLSLTTWCLGETGGLGKSLASLRKKG